MGALDGLKIVEFAGIGPGPFCAMLLADMGAEVLRLDRAKSVELGGTLQPPYSVLNRNRRSVAVDLKKPEGLAAVKRLLVKADGLIEGFRPGVMERLGLGEAVVQTLNPRLVYGRMTGWGQSGPMASEPGHDINFIALSGALHHIGPKEGSVPPLNLVGDFGGGGLFLAVGMLGALLERTRSGLGQVVDAAMVDGAAALMTYIYGSNAAGVWRPDRGQNIIDGGAPFYGVYKTKDGKQVAVGAVENRFYKDLLRKMGLDGEVLPPQLDRTQWPEMRARFAEVFASKTRDEWCEIMKGSEACFSPVLTMTEAPDYPQMRARDVFIEIEGVRQPAPAPRMSRTPSRIARGPASPGQHTDQALADWGFSADEIVCLRDAGAIR